MQGWPERLWLVRHGESIGNVALNRAKAAGLPRLDLDLRDADVPLSDLGRQQSRAVGAWFAPMPQDEAPELVLTSPYVRARQTAELIAAEAGLPIVPDAFIADERLREKEFGVLDLLTDAGIAAEFPDQARFRRMLGKFYHRPPGGESWCDVILRLRSLLDTVRQEHPDRRVLIVTHQVVVLCLRYLLEGLSEQELMAIDRSSNLANCAVTEYGGGPAQGGQSRMTLCRYNFTAPVSRSGTAVTAEPPVELEVR